MKYIFGTSAIQSLLAMLLLVIFVCAWGLKQSSNTTKMVTISWSDSETNESFDELEEEEDWVGLHFYSSILTSELRSTKQAFGLLLQPYSVQFKHVPAPPPKG